MALQSIEKKKAELQRARDAMTNAPSSAKQAMIKVRVGLLVGGIAMLAFDVAAALAGGSPQASAIGFIGAMLLLAWFLILIAGMFVS